MKILLAPVVLAFAAACAALGAPAPAEAPKAAPPKKVVFIAGGPSHGYGAHDYKSGCHLLAKLLNESGLPIQAEVCYPGWPKDETVLRDAAAIVVFADGGGRNPLAAHKDAMDALAKKGVGLGLLHYAVECPKGEVGDKFLAWTGGFYEDQWSCNPIWTPEFKDFPDHPVARGIRPFACPDEWYMNIRFDQQVSKPASILSAAPSDAVRNGPYSWPKGPYKHVQENKGKAETLMWALERQDGGRGFGFTGGHFHWNWGHPQQRAVVLNAIAWIAKVEVPEKGVRSPKLTFQDLDTNMDEAKPAKFDQAAIERQLAEWQK